MTSEIWNPDEATIDRADVADEVLGSVWRYGVTDWEAAHAAPLDVALAQELPEQPVDRDVDEQWTDVDEDVEPFAGRLLADDVERDDDLAVAVDDPDEFAPEELAMHVVEP